MNLATVMDQLGTALETLDKVNVFPFTTDRITPPAAIVVWPDTIDYDTAMARGGDRITLPVYLVVSRMDAKNARDRLARFVNGAGDASVKQALESYAYTACDSVRVTQATIGEPRINGVDYLAAQFQLDIIGPGGA
ncbi:hypothetical protein ABZU76_02970 [Amycolatopsis sp. NPDC005232]|uniref:hypothetical protein n=1 Tax=Amycolatopsis sp. NPDC005232 TaxID=3157027 RepID=UPI0033B264A4